MDKFNLLHTEAVLLTLAHGVPVLSLAGQLSAVWRQWRSNAVLVDRREELPPAEANVDLLCGDEVSIDCPSKAAEVKCRTC